MTASNYFISQQQQEDDEDEEEEEISEEAPVDHRQIKEDHIEIYGSDDAGDPDGSGGGSATGDYEISQEMYQDDDMQDDGSQVRGMTLTRLLERYVAGLCGNAKSQLCFFHKCDVKFKLYIGQSSSSDD